MKICYICTNYNNYNFTESAVFSLFNQNKKLETRVVIVDNNSHDDSKEKLRIFAKSDNRIRVIFSKTNLGYFQGLNVGIQEVSHDTFDLLIIGNNDLIFPKDFTNSLLLNKELLNIHPIISPNIVTLDGVHQNPHVKFKISSIREIIYYLYHSNYFLGRLLFKVAKLTRKYTRRGDEDDFDTPQHIFQGHASVFILSKLFIEQFGLLWAPTFLMGEEYNLSTQLAEKKYSVFYEPSITVTHHWHASVGNLPGKLKWQYSCVAYQIYKIHRKYHPHRLPLSQIKNNHFS